MCSIAWNFPPCSVNENSVILLKGDYCLHERGNGSLCPIIGMSAGNSPTTGTKFALCSKILHTLRMKSFAPYCYSGSVPKSGQKKRACPKVPSTTRQTSLTYQAWQVFSLSHHHQISQSRTNECFHLPFGRRLSMPIQNIQHSACMRSHLSAMCSSGESPLHIRFSTFLPLAQNP